MLPIASKLDDIGFWSIESWGGATFDACIRFLGEDPWERIRQLKKAMPKTPQQMLFRGQNILGYRHYADDVVTKLVLAFVTVASDGVPMSKVFPRTITKSMTSPVARLDANVSVLPETVNESVGACKIPLSETKN